MNLFKRATVSIRASLDSLVGQVENHEAIAQSAIRELDASLVRTKAKLAQLKRAGERLEERRGELCKSNVVWKERAVQNKEEDRERAIECIRRAKQIEQELSEINRQISQNKDLIVKLTDDISHFNRKHAALKLKIKELSARECKAQTSALTALLNNGEVVGLDELFERWEQKIDEREIYHDDDYDRGDDFEREFVDEEERLELEEELRRLSGDQ